MANIIYDPATCNDASPRHTLGSLHSFGGKLYRYVQFKDAVAYAAGVPCGWSASDTDQAVTCDVSEDNGVAAGIALCAVTENNYGFIQVSGKATVQFNNDDDAAAGAVCILDADGVANTGSDSGVITAFGIVLDSVVAATNKATVLLRGLI